MKRLFIIISGVLLLASLDSCTVYKNSPTPDDVYYNPGSSNEASSQDNSSTGDGADYYSTPNENYVKMRVQDPNRWSYFDDYNCDYYGGSSGYGYGSPYGSSFGMGIGFGIGYSSFFGGFGYYSPMSYLNSYYAWNNFYNPYYGHVIIVNGKNNSTPSYTRMSNFNPSAYQGRYYNARPASTRSNSLNGYQNSTRNSQNSNLNSNFNRSQNTRPVYSNPSFFRSAAPLNFSSGGGSRGGGFSRPGR